MKQENGILSIAMFGQRGFGDPQSGGVEVVITELSTRMAALGHKVTSINEQISNFAQTYPTSLKVSSNEALLFMRRYRFANCSCFSCCFKDAYPSSNVQ